MAEAKEEFAIEGLSSLMTHNPAGMVRGGTTTKGKVIPSPEEEAEAGTYRDEQGYLLVPSIGIRNGIIAVAASYRKGRQSLKSFVSHIIVDPEMLHLVDPSGAFLTEYEIDVRRAVVQRQGILRARPKIAKWGASLEIVYDPELLAGEEIRPLFTKLLNDAGGRMGLGDYRPQKGGWFGRYQVV